jgi:hypothetical protein
MSKWQKFGNRKLQKQEPKKPPIAVALSPHQATREIPASPDISDKKD